MLQEKSPPIGAKKIASPLLFKCGAEVETNISCSTVSFTTMIDPPSLETIRNIDCKSSEMIDSSLTQTLLYGNPFFDTITNSRNLNATIDFILSTKRFEEALFKEATNVFSICICFLIISQ